MEQLSDTSTKEKLLDILRLNGEISSVLDLIEQRQRGLAPCEEEDKTVFQEEDGLRADYFENFDADTADHSKDHKLTQGMFGQLADAASGGIIDPTKTELPLTSIEGNFALNKEDNQREITVIKDDIVSESELQSAEVQKDEGIAGTGGPDGDQNLTQGEFGPHADAASGGTADSAKTELPVTSVEGNFALNEEDNQGEIPVVKDDIVNESELQSVEVQKDEGIVGTGEPDSDLGQSCHTGVSSASQSQTKGILKTPDLGSKTSYGFKERLDLNLYHVKYGSQLRRHLVELHQDNRLCERFGLEPNIGCVYESKRSCSSDQVGESKSESNIAPRQTKQFRLVVPESSKTDASSALLLQEKTESGSEEKEENSSGGKTLVQANGKGHRDIRGQRHRKKPSEQRRRKLREQRAINQTDGQSPLQHMVVMQEGRMRQVSPVEGQLFLEALKSPEVQQMSQEDYVNMVEKDLDRQGLDFGLNPENRRKLLEIGVSTIFDENGKLDVSKMLQHMALVGKQFEEVQHSIEEEVSDSDEETSKDVELSEISRENESMTEDPPSEDDTEEERVDVELDDWISCANKEIEKGKEAKRVRKQGMDTIFCLDVSRSMKGVAWNQAVNFIKKFLEGIQGTTLSENVYEHVALVTYGSETCVQFHLTRDYKDFTNKLDQLKPGGPSPLYAGLQMTHATLIGSSGKLVVNGYRMYPRVFLLTDGKVTPAKWATGPDKCTNKEFLEEHMVVLSLVEELHLKFHVSINPVPVGNADKTMLELVAATSEGKIVSHKDWKMQSRTFKNYMKASKAGLLGILGPAVLDLVAEDVSQEDKMQMEEFLKTHKPGSGDSSDSSGDEYEGLPPLGTRVELPQEGTDILKLSEPFLGTVSKHFSNGAVGVTWDHPRENGSIREQVPFSPGGSTLTVVDEPRVLKDEMIAEGCRVRRGQDWQWGFQDGGPGNFGSVYGKDQNGWVKVKWSNGNKNGYRFGAQGKFDLEVVSDQQSSGERMSLKPPTGRSDEDLVAEMNKKNKMLKENTGGPGSKIEPGGASGGSADSTTNALSQTEPQSSFEDIMNAKNKSSEQTVPGFDENLKLQSDTDENIGTEVKEKVGSDLDVMPEKAVNQDLSSSVENASAGLNDPNSEFAGAKPKTVTASKNDKEKSSFAWWLWEEEKEDWQPFPADVSAKIENDFNRNPEGTSIIKLNSQQYRIMFPRMEKVNLKTKEKKRICRQST